MSIEKDGSNYFVFRGSLGGLVAVSFVVMEFFLLPLFEHARKDLTIAAVRYRIAQRKPVKICREAPVSAAFGVSDGVHGYSGVIVVPRGLKMFCKIALLLSVFAWEFELDTFYRAEMVSFQFNNLGPLGPKNESSLMFPLPVLALPKERVENPLVRNSFALDASETYKHGRVPGIELDYATHCVLRESSGRRIAYLGIYSHGENGQRKLFCFNGTDSREKAEVLTFDHSLVTSGTHSVLFEEVVSQIDNLTHIYSVVVVVPPEAELGGTHRGLAKVTRKSALSSPWNGAKEGFALHSTKGTIMQLFWRDEHDSVLRNCEPRGWQNVTLRSEWKREKCASLFNRPRNTSFKLSGFGFPAVHDIGLRVHENSKFRVATQLDAIHALLGPTPLERTVSALRTHRSFPDQIWDRLTGEYFYFSVPEKNPLSVRVGTPQKLVRMKKPTTLLMLIVITLFFAYCGISLVARYRSLNQTGIDSECITRTALIELVKKGTDSEGKQHLNAADSLTLGLASSGANSEQKVPRLLSMKIRMSERRGPLSTLGTDQL